VLRVTRAGTVGVVLLVLAVAGCDAPQTEDPGQQGTTTAATTGSRSPSPTATPVDERPAVESAYRAFWPVAASFANQPQERWRALLGRVATDPQLGYTLAATLQQRRTGTGIYGQTVPGNPTVRLAGGGQATVTDCADFSHTGKLDKDGNRRTVGVARTPLSVAMRKSTDRAWRVAEITFPAGTC
jgi:hypothetical protein